MSTVYCLLSTVPCHHTAARRHLLADTDQHIIDFIDQSNIPILTLNLLQALPKTPLWDRIAGVDTTSECPEGAKFHEKQPAARARPDSA